MIMYECLKENPRLRSLPIARKRIFHVPSDSRRNQASGPASVIRVYSKIERTM